jgi:hypothetical protein
MLSDVQKTILVNEIAGDALLNQLAMPKIWLASLSKELDHDNQPLH